MTTWDLETGQLRQCFRTITPRHRDTDVTRPALIEQNLPPLCRSATAAASRFGAGILQPAQQDAYLRELDVRASENEAADAMSRANSCSAVIHNESRLKEIHDSLCHQGDFKGPLPESATSTNRYIMTIIDEFSRFPFAFPS